MEKLGLLDQLFYKADQYHITTVVMGGVSILEPATARVRLDVRKLSDHLASRLEKIPLMRQKFVQDPLRLGSVHKVEDPHFDVSKHIVVDSVAAPGGYPELAAGLGRICSRPVDVTEIWRWTLVDGLQGGRLALVIQMHHAFLDGLGAGQAISSMHDSKPVRLEKPTGRVRRDLTEPGSLALLGNAVAESVRRLLITTPLFIRDNTLPLMGSLASGARDLLSRGGRVLEMPAMNATSLNTATNSGTRVVAYRTLELKEFKALAKRHHVTVNDAALLLFSYALEYYFRETGEQLGFDLWCAMPISTRTGNSSAGNQVAAARINLHNTLSDPLERLRAIHADTVASKQATHPEVPAVDPQALGELVFPLALEGLIFAVSALGLFQRLGSKFPVLNAILSNVPGPREPLYIGNSRVVESIPLIPAVDMLAVSGGITSVGDTITLGFNCDGTVVSNPELLVEGVNFGLDSLKQVSEQRHGSG